MVAVDDYGRFDADPEVLLADLMTRRPLGWSGPKMQRVIAEWTDGEDPLVHLYCAPNDFRLYGHAVNFLEHQRERDSKPKYPDPPCAEMEQKSTLQQLAAKCRESLQSAAYSDLIREPRGDLNINAGQVKPAPARKSSTDPNVSKLIHSYHDTYLLTHKSKPPINGAKCGAIAKKILQGRPFAEAQWMIEEFFRNPPELYAKKNLYGMEHILSASTTLLARSHKPKFPQEEK